MNALAKAKALNAQPIKPEPDINPVLDIHAALKEALAKAKEQSPTPPQPSIPEPPHRLVVAEHINGANSLAIGRSFKVSDKYVRVVIAKNIKIPRILDAATLRAAAMASAGSDCYGEVRIAMKITHEGLHTNRLADETNKLERSFCRQMDEKNTVRSGRPTRGSFLHLLNGEVSQRDSHSSRNRNSMAWNECGALIFALRDRGGRGNERKNEMSFRTVTDPSYIPNYRPGGVPIRQTVKPCKKPGCSNTFVGAGIRKHCDDCSATVKYRGRSGRAA